MKTDQASSGPPLQHAVAPTAAIFYPSFYPTAHGPSPWGNQIAGPWSSIQPSAVYQAALPGPSANSNTSNGGAVPGNSSHGGGWGHFSGLPAGEAVHHAPGPSHRNTRTTLQSVWGGSSRCSSAYSSAGGAWPASTSSSLGGAPSSLSSGGASTATQIYSYAVPCVMVPCGEPVLVSQCVPAASDPVVQSNSHRQSIFGGLPGQNGAFGAGPGSGGSVGHFGIPNQPPLPPYHNRGGRRGRHSHHFSTDSLSGSRSVSSFSSAGFYALVDSASEASHKASSSRRQQPHRPANCEQGQPPTSTSSATGDTASQVGSHNGFHQADEVPATGWGDLTVGILQNIIVKLTDSEVKQLRSVCRHWRAVVDHNLDTLTPNQLMSKLITLRFPNLKVLHLTNCSNVRNRDLQLLANGGLRLHTLTLGDDANRPWVSNIGLAWIGKVTTLTALNLQDCTQVTNRGLAFLQNLSNLAALSLRGCNKVNNMGLEGLRHNTALTSLNLAGCIRVSDKGLLPLTELPNLMSLSLGGTRVKDEGMEYLARITSLHDLHFAREAITNAGIMQLSTLTNLQTLALRECPQVTGDSLSELVPQLSNLQSLDLFQSHAFDDVQLEKCLDFLGSVTFLDLRGTVVSEEGISQLARLHNLQKLCLAPKNEVSVEQHLCVVSHLTQLTSLAINNCRLGSFDLMASLAHLRLLRELDISNNGQITLRASDVAVASEPVNDGAIRAMTNITSLTSIDLSRRSVHEEQLNVLAERLPKLRTLFVVGCPVLYETLQALHRRFPELVIHRKPLHDMPGSSHSCSSSEHNFL